MKTPRQPLFYRTLTFLALLLSVFVLAVCSDDEIPAPNLVVSISGAHSMAIGETLALSATTTGGADSAHTWQTSRSTVATVDSAGVVTGVAEGETIITATGVSSRASGDHVIVVVPATVKETPFVRVTGNPYVLVGQTVALTAQTVDGDDAGYAWVSSDEAVATVDASGVVTGRTVGDATITATGSDTGMSDGLLVAVVQESPNYDKWLGSAHADASAQAFNNWNGTDPQQIPTSCAKCHSAPGFLDFIGEDGSAPEVVDQPAPTGTVIHCGACHNDTANALSSVTFPSGVVVDELGPEARCMTCHQGRASTDSVDSAIATAGVATDDEPTAALSFQNIHYYAAGATLNAGRVRGGYQYTGKVYDWRFRHVPGKDTCVGCHDPHSLEVRLDACQTCHQSVQTKDDLKNIRMMASLGQDYDGDGDRTEGIFYEMQGLRGVLLTAIQAYAPGQGLGAICYDESAYPYWFKDTDADGACSATEAQSSNAFGPWTARLLRATYNYQVSLKDPGAFAHNAKYMIQLMVDSAEDINGALAAPADLSATVRTDVGHFNGASEAARNWDENEEVSQSCSRCHGGSEGFRFYLQYGVGTAGVEPDNGMDCATCHDSFGATFDTVPVNAVTFPSGISISDPGNISNICMTCHQGRESKKTIDDAIAQNKLGFRNVHYLPAGAVKKGTLAKVAYEYTGKTYSGDWVFHGQCVNCHDAAATNHSFLPGDNALCTNGCHANGGPPIDVHTIRTTKHPADYDNDGNTAEPLHDELTTYAGAVLTQMQLVSGSPGARLCYASAAYPYFFKDLNSSGIDCEAGEAVSSNRFNAWTPALMKAAHNFQIFQKEPGAWAHNFDYMAQLLYDSVEDLGGDPSPTGLGFIRPAP